MDEIRIEHQRLIPLARTHGFKFSDELMRDKGLCEGVDYTLVITKEKQGEKTA